MKTHEELTKEQKITLETPRVKYGVLAKLLFVTMDIFYGRKTTRLKIKVLELIARMPYQAWEHVAYIAITHTYRRPDFARRIFGFVLESRLMQDNEQWHLLIVTDMIRKDGEKEGFLMHRAIPQIICFLYYHTSWWLYVLRPAASYRLNYEFEDHAEHVYMEYVRDHPQLEEQSFVNEFESDYGSFDTVADLFRQIALDEREHKEDSLRRLETKTTRFK